MGKEANTIGTKFKGTKEFPYKIDVLLKHKLDVLIKTIDKRDIWILIDGDEGSGKTNTAVYLLYYFHCMTGREFTLDRFYFDSDEMFEWVKDNENGLICWDEATLGGLSTEWASRSQINLLKFAMTGRKKHHIFILNVPRFNKLKEDLRKDRIHALIHMDTGKQGTDYGHFVYLTRRGIKALNRAYEKNKMKPYARCAQKYGGFYCSTRIPYVMPNLIDEVEYERKKDKAISEIGSKKENSSDKKRIEFEAKMYAFMKEKGISADEFAERAGISVRTVYRRAKEGGVLPTAV